LTSSFATEHDKRLAFKVQNQIRMLPEKSFVSRIAPKTNSQPIEGKVSLLLSFVQKLSAYLQRLTASSSSALPRPRRTQRTKPIPAIDLDSDDTNDSDLDDNDFDAIAKAKTVYKLRSDSFA
jgi:hypothetical protein